MDCQLENVFFVSAIFFQDILLITRAVRKFRGLAAVHRCYAGGGGYCYVSCNGGGNLVVV